MILEGRQSSVLVVRFIVRGKAVFWLEISRCIEYPDVFPKDVSSLSSVGTMLMLFLE